MASQLWRCLRYLLIHFVFHLPRPRFHTVINDIIYATMPESSTNDEGTSRADEGDFRPEGCIPSHELCKECNVFFDDWEVLDWLENHKFQKLPTGGSRTSVQPLARYIHSGRSQNYCNCRKLAIFVLCCLRSSDREGSAHIQTNTATQQLNFVLANISTKIQLL